MARKKSTKTSDMLIEAQKTGEQIKTNVGILSEQQLEVFDKHHSALNNAYHYDVIGRTDRVTEMDLGLIYFDVTGFQLMNWNCNSCRLNNWKKLGALYYKSLEYYKKTGGTQDGTE